MINNYLWVDSIWLLIIYCDLYALFSQESPWEVCHFSCLAWSRGEHKAIAETQVSLRRQLKLQMFVGLGVRFPGPPLPPGSCVYLCSLSCHGFKLGHETLLLFYKTTSHQAFGNVMGPGVLQCPPSCHFVSTLLFLCASWLIYFPQVVLTSKPFFLCLLSPPELPTHRQAHQNHHSAQRTEKLPIRFQKEGCYVKNDESVLEKSDDKFRS